MSYSIPTILDSQLIHIKSLNTFHTLVPFLPKQISTKAIFIYILSLAAISIIFFKYMMKLDFIIIDIVWVLLFFLLSSRYTVRWSTLDEKKFVRRLFFTALIFRVVWVTFSYFYYTIKTGIPFEFSSSDALGYHEAAIWFRQVGWKAMFDYISRAPIGDTGYPVYLTLLYSVIGPNVYLARLVKSLLSALTCVLVYRLSRRVMNEETGRMAGIFCCLAPNLIMYCGMHLKETEMIFLTVAALERADSVLRGRSVNVWNVLLTVLLVGSLFTFRSVLGSTTIFAIITALVFSNTSVVGRWNRVVLISWAVLALAVFASGTIANEAQALWQSRNDNQIAKRDYQVHKGIRWAKYATGTVMAPMMFVLPFPTMVDVDEQYNQQLINGGNYVRNFMGIFVLIGIFGAVFVKKQWRDLTMVGAFVISYLGVISASGFANSERFLLPGMPFLLIIAAYGVSLLNGGNYRWVKIWYGVVPLMIVGWAVFKLGSRGIL